MNNKDKANIDDTLTRTMNAAVEKEAVASNKNSKNITAVDKDKLALIKESYKAIRTNLILSLPQGGCHKIVISSAVLGEGKSTTSANLATSLAQTDKKVLLIDADLRKPSIYSSMGFSNTPGFTNVLTGLSTLEEAVNDTAFPNLDVLCAGISVPNPGELLACEATAKFIESLEEKYDYILFDTPPINVVADVLPIIRMSDGVVLVVRQNYSTYPEISRAKQSIEFIGGKILGFVFNDVEDDRFTKNKYGRYGKYYK
ncbi:MAG: CpsD/CapB family tyrosine-protein kinase [Ruminococcaceae bacterium]|nr:CpsD/CapB family tyrosine-protein kinase [Oscillospiraceae bacterium]